MLVLTKPSVKRKCLMCTNAVYIGLQKGNGNTLQCNATYTVLSYIAIHALMVMTRNLISFNTLHYCT